LGNKNLKKLETANQKLYEHFYVFEQCFFDSLQERFKYLNPWLINLVKITGTYHGYVSKVYEQLAERVDILSQTEDFNLYKNKLFDFSKIESFVQIIQNFEQSNSNGSQLKSSQVSTPQSKPESKPVINSKNPFANKNYQNFDRAPSNPQPQSLIPNFPPTNVVKPPVNTNISEIATQNRNVNMFGMPKSNPNVKKPPLNPLNLKNIDGNFANPSDITQSQQFTNPFSSTDKTTMYFGKPNQGHSAQGYKDQRHHENTWTPNPKSQSFSQIREFVPRSSSKDDILQLNFDPAKK